MSDSTWEGRRTICEVLREILDAAEELRNSVEDMRLLENAYDITVKTHEAVDMAKRMDSKLREYKHDYDGGSWYAG